jgi:branched-chain amino acid transport system substrate-binding protein
MLKKLTLILPLGLFLFFIASLSKAEPTEKPNILMLLPLSGPYASLGVDTRQGIEVALDELSSPLQANLIYGDARAEPNQAISEFNRALSLDKIISCFAFRGPVGMAINPISKAKKIPILGAISNKKFSADSPFAFQLWTSSDLEAAFITRSFEQLGAKKIALLTAEDDYTKAVSTEVSKFSAQAGLTITLDQDFAPSEQDFRSAALSLSKLQPDLIFINVSIAQIAPLVKQLRLMNIQSKLISNFWLQKKEVIESLGAQANGLYFVEISTEYPTLRKSLQEKYASLPSAATIAAYVATHMFDQALNSITSQDFSSDSLYKSLSNLKDVKTKSGTFLIEDRKVQFPLTLKVIKNSKPEIQH